MNSTNKTSHTHTHGHRNTLHNKEDWKIPKEIWCFLSQNKSALQSLYSLDVSTEGHRQYPHITPAFPVNPLPETQSCYPMAHCWQEWVKARRKRDQEDKWWRTETWLDVTYLLSKLSWGRTEQGLFFFFFTLKVRQAPPPLANTTPVPVLLHLFLSLSLHPSWHNNRAFWINVDENKYSQQVKSLKPGADPGLSTVSLGEKPFTVYYKSLVLLL